MKQCLLSQCQYNQLYTLEYLENNCGIDFLVVMRQWHMFQRGEYGGGPIFKVVLEYKKRCYEPFLIYIFGIQCDFMPKSC